MVTLCRKCHKRRTELGSSSELQPFETVLHLMTVGGVPGLLDELFEALTLPDPEDVHENGWHTVVSAIKDRFPPVPPRQNQTQTQTQKQTKGVTPPVTQALHKRSKGSK